MHTQKVYQYTIIGLAKTILSTNSIDKDNYCIGCIRSVNMNTSIRDFVHHLITNLTNEEMKILIINLISSQMSVLFSVWCLYMCAREIAASSNRCCRRHIVKCRVYHANQLMSSEPYSSSEIERDSYYHYNKHNLLLFFLIIFLNTHDP